MKVVAYQGEPGAYSEMASMNYFGGKNLRLSPSVTFDSVFRKVSEGEADFGVVPIENSLYGSVYETYDLLVNYTLTIIGELNLQIHHYLLGKSKYSIPQIKRIYSHPQALGQCSKFLTKLKNTEVIPEYDTAGAAKIVSSMDEPAAAIASKNAAERYNLQVISSNIQNEKKNYTRFVVISPKAQEAPLKDSKTSIVFDLNSTPGSLFRALSVFALRDIDLTKIESRPKPAKTFQYLFYVDLKGSLKDKKVVNALNHLKEISSSVRVLGSYAIGKTFNT
ncbi:MAG: prephenate dehydratase [Bacteroidota bacterium]|jgi:prephenate dehydratase|nr:prephenate dehydratase [Ignavibacteria bacterium]MCU7501241.1 prephenate dehydratase [Ignavibacteria bacterium]MCU7514642.1 prephenate dehydratase [Ignavibacteria bacterium]MCU7522766.1 prephenate dehydratase [Ignavibacteria bacterium]MCU7526553.1 prephenate dehydratase [Ignavibacteria bacterium]